MLKMESFELESCVRGQQVYQRTWTPALGKELQCARESSNSKYPYAVAVFEAFLHSHVSCLEFLFCERRAHLLVWESFVHFLDVEPSLKTGVN